MKQKNKRREFLHGPLKREYLPPEIYKYAKSLRAKSMKNFIKLMDYNFMKKNKMLTKRLHDEFSRTLWDYECGDLWIEKLKDTVEQLKEEVELSKFQTNFLRALIGKYRKLTKH